MNILYIDHYAGSPAMGMEFRPYYLSREWIKLGHKVTIIAADYSHLRTINPSIDGDFQTQMIDGIEYVWLHTAQYDGNGARRAITMAQFVSKLWRNARLIAQKWQPNVVIASSTYPLDAYPAYRIARISGAKYVHEVHDMWPATLYEIGGMSKKNPFVVVMQIAENYAYKHCDACVSLPPYTKEYMVNHGLRPEKHHVVQNGVVAEEWEKVSPLPTEHQDFFNAHSEKFIVGYFGGHALSNALDNVMDAAKRINNPNIIFVFVGKGVEKGRLIERAKTEAIQNVFFLDPVDKRCIPDLLHHFDCSIFSGANSPLYRFGLCLNKMFDSMMAGIPTICAINAPKTLIEEYSCGYQMSGDDLDSICDAILKVYKMSPEERTIIGARGRRAILDNYTYEQLAKQFLDAME